MKNSHKTLLAAAISLGLMAGCNSQNDSETPTPMVRFATFNLSFDRTAAGMLAGELALSRTEQDALLARLADGTLSGAEKTKALDVQQIRNIAEIVQRTRPDVFLLNEFDNDGKGSDTTDLKAFNDNYLAHAQHDEVKAISYPVLQNFATNVSYVFSGDANGDGAFGNDLIYIPRDASEMNFLPLTVSGRTYTPAEQAAAFEAYIQQDPYLRKNRGKYAERGGLFLPTFRRMDLSLVQDIFKNIKGTRNAGQIRLDITNFGNLLNSDWGVAQRMVVATTAANGAQVLAAAGADAQGRLAYRMATSGGQLVTQSFQSTSSLSDVYQVLLSFRFSFN